MKFVQKYILVLTFVAGMLVSCNDYEQVYSYSPKVQFSVATLEVEEGVAPLTVTVQLVGPQLGTPVEVGFEAGGTAVEGRDFALSVPGTLSIPANSSTADFTVTIIDDAAFSGEERLLDLKINSASAGISVGNEGEDRRNLAITITENDCSIDWLAGTFSVRTTDTNPASCENTVNTVTITQVNANTYQLSDITGGLYKNCFQQVDSPGRMVLEGDSVFFVNQSDILGDIINGRGRVNTCDQNFRITWSNTFGDEGTSTYTLQ